MLASLIQQQKNIIKTYFDDEYPHLQLTRLDVHQRNGVGENPGEGHSPTEFSIYFVFSSKANMLALASLTA